MLISLANINVGGNKASIKVIIHKGNMNGLLFFTPDSFFNMRSSNITAIFKYVMNDKIHTNINNDSGCWKYFPKGLFDISKYTGDIFFSSVTKEKDKSKHTVAEIKSKVVIIIEIRAIFLKFLFSVFFNIGGIKYKTISPLRENKFIRPEINIVLMPFPKMGKKRWYVIWGITSPKHNIKLATITKQKIKLVLIRLLPFTILATIVTTKNESSK